MRYTAKISWNSDSADLFLENKYSRLHSWVFDGGIEVPASSSPHVVAVPMSSEAAVDPEEAFIASLSSCHMLWFLSLAADAGYIVSRYADTAEGILGKDAEEKMAMIKVILKPHAQFEGENIPANDEIAKLHHAAHEKCFIANSVKTEIIIEPVA